MNLLKLKEKFFQYFDHNNIENLNINFSKLTIHSKQKIFWKCTNGHSFSKEARHFFKSPACPHCNINLLTLNEKLFQYFDHNNLENLNIDLSTLTIHSRKKVFWKCKNGHSFSKEARHFFKSQSCPHCVSQESNFISKNNKLMKEWDFEKNKSLDPNLICEGNNRLKAWFICSVCNNSWNSRIYSRAIVNTGCPTCANAKKHSKNEIRIYAELKSIFKDVYSNFEVENFKYDIFIKDLNLLIEYDGFYWHQNNTTDLKKCILAEKNGYDLIRIREYGLNKISKDDLLLPEGFDKNNFKTQKDLINLLLTHIGKKYNTSFEYYIENKNFLNIETYNEYENFFKPEKSVANSIFFNEWNFDKNNGVNPENISYKSSTLYWWKCDKAHDHEWQSSPLNRHKNKCPFCSNRKISITNRFDLIETELIKNWDFQKNIKKPSEYTNRNSIELIHWICKFCNSNFSKSISNMVDTKGFCPCCKKKNKIKILYS